MSNMESRVMSDRQTILAELDALAQAAENDAATAADVDALEQVRIDYLGRKGGRLSSVMRGLGALDPGDRPAVGARANEIKSRVQAVLDERLASLATPGLGDGQAPLDLTLPSRHTWSGAIHPVSAVIEEVWQIFKALGFTRARGPEAETEWYNFVALNTPLDHPAADEQDTLYLDKPFLLRSHTSPVQIRTMQEHEPPIRILAPGMAYRRDTADATHTPAFAQIEGLVVDEGVTFVDFRATLAEFARRFWGPDTRVRFRPSFFPFTEPSAEMDVKYTLEGPDGQPRESEWLEIMGAGMVDPAVLEHVGYDPERYTGWAFGMGPARIAMTKYGIPDIRAFIDNDVRFLSQFRAP
jgi:phenylalanyl-tRNA synthetase alpha chain